MVFTAEKDCIDWSVEIEKNNKKVFQNAAGANLLNGIASSLISNFDLNGKINKDFAIFEIDENTLPLILKEINNPDFIIILNLSRLMIPIHHQIPQWLSQVRAVRVKSW